MASGLEAHIAAGKVGPTSITFWWQFCAHSDVSTASMATVGDTSAYKNVRNVHVTTPKYPILKRLYGRSTGPQVFIESERLTATRLWMFGSNETRRAPRPVVFQTIIEGVHTQGTFPGVP